jgi:hypothetical protein
MINFENDWPDSDYGYIETEDMLGETITEIVNETENRKLIFHTKDGQIITMFHEQDCCEDVELHDINGDLRDLIGSPLVMAESVESDATGDKDEEDDGYHYESATWTFYKLGTNKGSVTLRWLGVSNGYYSESVSLQIEGGNNV